MTATPTATKKIVLMMPIGNQTASAPTSTRTKTAVAFCLSGGPGRLASRSELMLTA